MDGCTNRGDRPGRVILEIRLRGSDHDMVPARESLNSFVVFLDVCDGHFANAVCENNTQQRQANVAKHAHKEEAGLVNLHLSRKVDRMK